MPRFKLTIEYNGTRYSGWQIQTNARTIQGELVKAVRDVAGPNVPITIDSNCGWSVTSAKQTLRRLADLGVIVAEQPIPPNDPAAMAEVRQDTTIPVMADESVFTLLDAWQLTLHRACDILIERWSGKSRCSSAEQKVNPKPTVRG